MASLLPCDGRRLDSQILRVRAHSAGGTEHGITWRTCRNVDALLVEVPEQLARPRFNCNTNHRASCWPGWRTAAGEDRFP